MQTILAPFSVILLSIRTWWDDLINLLVLNLAWFACQITIFLGPPATLSIFHLTRQLADGVAPSLREFVEYTRHYFVKGWMWMLANLLAIAIVWSNLVFYSQFDEAWAYYARLIFIALGLFWLPLQFFALPYLVIQENSSLRLAWKNGLLTILASPGYTLVILLFAALVILLSVVMILPLLFGVGMLIPTLGNQVNKDRVETFRSMVKKRETGDKL
jgi:uncharacterized membrane protein YesL